MATTETIGNPLANLFTSDKYDVRPSVFTGDASGYEHGEIVTFDETTNTYAKCVLGTDQADGVVYDEVEADGTVGLVVTSGGVRASLLVGYSALATDALKGAVRGDLLNKNIYVEDL